ncbi:MAG: hypothetical protein D3919_08315 [Candidatus Electrothrix sp. AW5]|nr:hypothetical protein [Candidatus Electrothrix gigas]
MLEKREGTPSCLKLFDYFVKYFFQTKERTDTGFPSGDTIKKHRSKERKSIGQGKVEASLEGR